VFLNFSQSCTLQGGGKRLSLAHKSKYYRARISTWHLLATKGKGWCELQLSVMVLPCCDVMEEPFRPVWRKGRQWWAPALSPLTLITPLGAPQHPHHSLLQSPAHSMMQNKSHSLYQPGSPSPHMFPLSPSKIKPQLRRVTSWSLISDSKAYLEPICNVLTPKIALPCDA